MNEKEYNKITENIEKEKKYELKEGVLYRKKKEKQLQVIRRWELEGVLYMMHDHILSANLGIKAKYEKTKERYYWKGLWKDVEEYVKSCDKCQRRERPIGRNELHPIEVKEPFHMIGIDFVGPLPITEKGNRYIIVAMDYFMKWPEAKAVKEDNNWDDMISPTLFAYRSKIQESTKIEPFYLVYGRKPVLPMDREEKKISLIERIQEIVERIPKIRYRAKMKVKKSQDKQKEY